MLNQTYFFQIFQRYLFNQMKLETIIFLTFLFVSTSATLSHEAELNLRHDQTAFRGASYSSSKPGAGNILAGFILGPFLFFCAIVGIWFNQKRAAIDSRRLKLAGQICEDVDVNDQSSAMHQNGKLVYGYGQTRTSVLLRDNLSGVAGRDLIKIWRNVQVLQWRRHTRKQDDRQYDYYQLQWVSHNSTNQGQRFNNPANWFIQTDIIYNSQVYLGGYNIDKGTAELCQKSVPFQPNMEQAQNIIMNTNRRDRNPSISGEYIYFAPGGSSGYRGMQGQAMGEGEGTLRVRYNLCPTGQMSICAKATDATFSPFPIAAYEGTQEQTNDIPDCCCCCVSSCYAELLKPITHIHLVQQRNLGKGQMFQVAVQKSQTFTRLVRIACYLGMVFGICLFFSPITTLIGYIPLVGGFISGVLFWAIFIAALIICLPIFIIVLSIAWLRYRPKIGLIILGIGLIILAVVLIVSKTKSGSNQQTSQDNAHFMALIRTHLG